MADDRVTVIPLSNAALQAAETPYVAFEHPFKNRPGRFARQADAMDKTGSMAAYAVGDVWPMGQEKPYTARQMKSFVNSFTNFSVVIQKNGRPASSTRSSFFSRALNSALPKSAL